MLRRLSMPNPADLRQIFLAAMMILFFISSMSLVWTFAVMRPYMWGRTYIKQQCRLVGLQGVPKICQNDAIFRNFKFDNIQRACDQDFCNLMPNQTDCIQIIVAGENVTKKDNAFVLHLDEIDVVGVCGSQRHCSIRSAASVCKSRRDCKSLSENIKHFFDSLKDLALNKKSECWIDENRNQIEGALASRKMNSFFDAKIIHAVIWPGLGFSTSILSCSTFWWKNRNRVRTFTQSG